VLWRFQGSVKRIAQVVHQVFAALDTDRQPDQCVVNAELDSFGIGNRGVCHERRRLGQRFDRAQRLGQCKDMQLDEYERGTK